MTQSRPVERLYRLYMRTVMRLAASGVTRRLGPAGRLLANRMDIALRGVLHPRAPNPCQWHGFVVHYPPGSFIGAGLAAGTYEPGTVRLFERLFAEAEPPLGFADVGGHAGLFSLLAGDAIRRRGIEGYVYAFEADPDTAGILRTNVQTNGLAGQVEVVETCVADRVGQTDFYVERRDGLTSSLYKSLSVGWGSIRRPVTSLDAFFGAAGWPPLRVLKIDVEGAEQAVLSGMRELSARNPKLKALIEFFPDNLAAAGVDAGTFFATLAELGFERVSTVDEHTQEMRLLDLPGDVSAVVARCGRSYVNLLCEKE
jgi:FkbM family methyltransferase